MDWIDSHRRFNEGVTVTVRNCRMNRLLCFLRTNWYCMHGSSQQCLQHGFDRFFAACDHAGMKISTKKIEVLCLARRPRQCIPQVSGNTLQQVERFKYLRVVFTSDGNRNKEVDTRIGKANAVLRELYNHKAFSFLIGHCSYPHLWSWILGDDWKNTVERINGRGGKFAKSSWCDTS